MYLVMRADKRIRNKIKFRDLDMEHTMPLTEEEIKKIQDITVLFMIGDKGSVYPDFIEQPIPMISDRLKKLLEKYDDTTDYKKVIWNQKGEKQALYWTIFPKKILCFSKNSTYYPNGMIKEIRLNKEQIGRHKIFRMEEKNNYDIVVHLDVAESIMRRAPNGVLFTSIEAD